MAKVKGHRTGRSIGSRNRGYFFCDGRGWCTKIGGKFVPLEYDPGDVVLRHQYGVALSRSSFTKEAVAVFSAIIDEESQKSPATPTLLMALKTRVINLRRLGKEGEAAADLKTAEKILVDNPRLAEHASHFIELRDDGSDDQ